MRVVVAGSGLAGVTVAEALAKDPQHEVCLVTTESHGYYSRPRLSHGFAMSDEAAAKIVMKSFEALAPVRVLAETEVAAIDREKQHALLDSGDFLKYDVLILATGSAARIPPVLAPSRPHFFTLSSFDDLLALRRRRAKTLARSVRPRWAVIGGGLIGCEVASDLRKGGDAVTIFHREPRLLELQLDEEQSQALHWHFAGRGVEARYRQNVLSVLPHSVVTAQGEVGPFDGVIVSTGFAPRVELAQHAGLDTGRGITVDPHLRTADPNIHAVGDVAEIGARLFPFVSPIRSQALWLAEYLARRTRTPWAPPRFSPVIKVHEFKLPANALAAGSFITDCATLIRAGSGVA
jgi:NAD(P)H-nitrite reductase large subunit